MSTQEPRSPVDVPGTPIFDGQTSRRGLRMNKMFMSFRDEANRTRFLADEAAYCQEYGLTPEQQQAIAERTPIVFRHVGYQNTVAALNFLHTRFPSITHRPAKIGARRMM